jgi:hypothetical protein
MPHTEKQKPTASNGSVRLFWARMTALFPLEALSWAWQQQARVHGVL